MTVRLSSHSKKVCIRQSGWVDGNKASRHEVGLHCVDSDLMFKGKSQLTTTVQVYMYVIEYLN